MMVLLTSLDGPEEAQFLDHNEKKLIMERLRRDKSDTKPEESGLRLFRQVLLDPQTWLLVLLTLCITIPSGVITTFSAVLIHSFGYDSKQSALLNMPSGVVSIFATILSTWAILKAVDHKSLITRSCWSCSTFFRGSWSSSRISRRHLPGQLCKSAVHVYVVDEG
jgi:hypothetical protein